MHRIKPQTIDVIIPHPHQLVVAEESPHLITSPVVKVDRTAPQSMVPISKVRPKFSRVVPYRPEVVVNHIENHREPARMASIHQPLQSVRPAIPLVHSKQRRSVITPPALSWKSRH